MSLASRVIAILSQPKTEVPRAAAEPAPQRSLIGGYAAVLAALPAIGAFIGFLLVMARFGFSIGSGLITLIIGLLLTYGLRDLGLTIGVGYALAAVAPNLGGRKDNARGVKLAILAATPIWLAAFIAALLIGLIPELANLRYLILIAGFGYAGYILYLGSGPMLGVPKQQAAIFGGGAAVVWLIAYLIVERIVMWIITPSFGPWAMGI